MKRLVLVLLVIGLVATVVFIRYGKVIGKPSEADCRTVTENRISQANLAQMVEIVSFKKSHSYTTDFMGATFYVVSFEIEVRYLNEVTKQVYLPNISQVASSNSLAIPSAPKGSLRRMSSEMTFWKTDKGWRGQDGKFY